LNSLPLLVRAWRDPGKLCELSAAEWDLLLRQAESARLLASLGALLEQQGLMEALPSQVRERFSWWKAVGQRHRQSVRHEVMQIQAALRGLGIPLVLLKGAAYAMAGLPPAQGRLFSDIDIMVPKEMIGQAEAALMLGGWAGTLNDAYDQRYYRTWMHELAPMQHIRRGTHIDVHHAILPETAPVRPDPALLRAAAVAVEGEPGLQVLAPADMVLHSAVHLFYGEFDNGLRDLVDIHRLLLHFGAVPGFWENLPARAAGLELSRPLFYALRYTVELFATPVPDATLQAVAQAGRPGGIRGWLMAALLGRALRPNHPGCRTALTGTALFMLYVRANWLRMPPLLLARHLLHKAVVSPKK
jgi:hypothetical protein